MGSMGFPRDSGEFPTVSSGFKGIQQMSHGVREASISFREFQEILGGIREDELKSLSRCYCGFLDASEAAEELPEGFIAFFWGFQEVQELGILDLAP